MFLNLSRDNTMRCKNLPYHSLPYKQEGTLGRANVRKDFLDYNWGQEKNWPIADGRVFNNNP